MIGGCDIVIPAVGDSAALEACARIIGRHWRDARFEDAVTGEKYQSLERVPLGKVSELLVYADAVAEAAWDADGLDSAENSMIYLIVRLREITIVVDDPATPEVSSILDSIRGILSTDILGRAAA